MEVLSQEALKRRAFWVSEIVRLSGNFGQDVSRVAQELNDEIASSGTGAILDHLRLCGTIPESYGHDSSEEKLYSKYTDVLIAAAFRSLGLSVSVLTERADAADVEAVAPSYNFVADAKAFRLSRTAKNQKDFKVQAMDTWKRGKDYAMIVGPLHQLPATTSQIYQQAIARDVCLLSFSHLAVIIAYASGPGSANASAFLEQVLRSTSVLPLSKDAIAYWTAINRAILEFDASLRDLWRTEKLACLEAIAVAREEGLAYWAQQRTKIMSLSRDEAIQQLLTVTKIDGRIRAISRCAPNGLMDLE